MPEFEPAPAQPVGIAVAPDRDERQVIADVVRAAIQREVARLYSSRPEESRGERERAWPTGQWPMVGPEVGDPEVGDPDLLAPGETDAETLEEIPEHPVAMVPASAPEPQPDKHRSRGWLVTLLVTLLVVVVVAALAVFAVPRIPDWIDQFDGDNGTDELALGTSAVSKETIYHPRLKVTISGPLAGAPAKLASGRALTSVVFDVTNQGDSVWAFPMATRVRLVDSLGIEYRPVAKARPPRGAEMLPGNIRVGPGQQASGLISFALPKGRTLKEVRLALDGKTEDDSGELVWHLP